MKLNPKLPLIGVLTALATIALASTLLPPQEDFNPSNPYWNGLMEFTKIASPSIIDAATYKPDPKTTILFVIGPSINITEKRIEAWRRYVEDGGILVLMDETGSINHALEILNIKVRVNGHVMLDPVFYYNSWRIPKITDFRDDKLMGGIREIAMDIPSVLEVTGEVKGLKILAYSSSFSFLDLDGNGEPSKGEPSGPFPIAVEVKYGGGSIILFSDSSIFINGVIGLGDNIKLLKNIMGGRVAVIDSGVWLKTPQSQLREYVLTAYKVICTTEIKYSLILVTVILIYMLTGRVGVVEVRDEVEELMSKHPDWDRRTLEMLREARGKYEQ
ncbi:MAG: DUF4350 domain-containing protein [archaeon YNP-LCB-003-016]|uniref:DUF4350 domain-containing protein n=1 Tax=Candidatus Culexarchaeum yellowstonense TaxID=2928963 RepID=UPI0026EA0483|nr:DUF4350 domain-containing protein [Candidatus Culexarchaeum yellowstonense]MCR6692786.1 DUF4350 domain-containing protein [Candidatus Culexarchaeum yellowstonense]